MPCFFAKASFFSFPPVGLGKSFASTQLFFSKSYLRALRPSTHDPSIGLAYPGKSLQTIGTAKGASGGFIGSRVNVGQVIGHLLRQPGRQTHGTIS